MTVRSFRLLHLVYGLVACYALMRAGLPGAPSDVWWQIATGRLIAQQGQLPTADVFTHTCAGHPWVVHEWAWELLMYRLYTGWGYAGLMALRIAVLVPAALLLTWVCFRRGGRELPVLGTVILGVLAMGPVVNDRPQLTGVLFLISLLALIEQARQGCPRWLWLAPLPIWLWANIHGSFIYGPGLLTLYALSQVPRWWTQRRAAAPLTPAPTLVVGVLALSGLVCFLNPHGVEGVLYPLRYAFGDLSYHSQFITEYGPPQFGGMDRFLGVFLLLLLTALALSRRPVELFDLLTVLVFTYFVLKWGRNVGLATFMLMPVVAAQLSSLGTADPPAPRPQEREPAWLYTVILVLMLGLSAVSLKASLARCDQVFAEYTPRGAVEYVQQARPQGPMFNTYEWGGYLVWGLWPQHKVFIDGRGDVMGREFMTEYLRLTALQPGWRQVLDKYGVQWAVLPPGTLVGEALRLDRDFALARATGEFEVFVRTPGPNDRLLRPAPPAPAAARKASPPRTGNTGP